MLHFNLKSFNGFPIFKNWSAFSSPRSNVLFQFEFFFERVQLILFELNWTFLFQLKLKIVVHSVNLILLNTFYFQVAFSSVAIKNHNNIMDLGEDLPFETLLQLESVSFFVESTWLPTDNQFLHLEPTQKLGSKTFREIQAAKNGSSKKTMLPKHRPERRQSDDAPEEFSSKHPPRLRAAKQKVDKTLSIDPRFSSKAGTYKEKHFRKNFQFAFDLKDKELEELKQITASSNDIEEVKKAKFLIQRLENQKRAHKKKSQELKPSLMPGGTKYFPSKKEILAKNLVDQFKELKEAGKLPSHLEKRRKKLAGQERKRMGIEK